MPKITLTKQRVAKNGLVSYQYNTKRGTGVIYVSPKMFEGNDNAKAPATLVLEADGFRDVAAEEAEAARVAAATAAAAPAQPAGEAPPAAAEVPAE